MRVDLWRALFRLNVNRTRRKLNSILRQTFPPVSGFHRFKTQTKRESPTFWFGGKNAEVNNMNVKKLKDVRTRL